MKIHEIQRHFQAEVIVWWEWLPATIIGLAKSSPSRLEAAPTIFLNFFSGSKEVCFLIKLVALAASDGAEP
jgi:hypothetical protein